jgi:hypothetical protein
MAVANKCAAGIDAWLESKGRARARPFVDIRLSSSIPVHPWQSTADEGSSGSPKLFGRHLARLVVAHDFVAELLALGDVAHTSALNGGDVPLVALNHFTVPVVMNNPPSGRIAQPPRGCAVVKERFSKGVFVRSAPKRQ